MKTLLHITFILAVLQINLTAQWYWLNPVAGTEPIKSIKFTSVNIGYCVGAHGVILKTQDGGSNWLSLTSGINTDLYSVCFLNDDIGIAVGDSGAIIKTTDGGTNWNLLPRMTNETLLSIYFVNENVGYISGTYSFILKTTNGGDDWVSISVGNYYTLSVHFTDENIGYITAWQPTWTGILKTTNGGLTWVANQIGNNFLWTVYFVNDSIGYSAGSGGHLYRTTDTGNIWSSQNSNTGSSLLSIYFNNTDIGYVVGSGGTILKTTNGGNNWTRYGITDEPTLRCVYFLNESYGFTVGDNGILVKTTNAGYTWIKQQFEDISTDFASVFFCNEFIGYAAGHHYGTIYKTTNGGYDWINQMFVNHIGFYSIYFTDTLNGFAVGSPGKILKTTNGGNEWINQYNGSASFTSVFFINQDTGYIVGYDGIILKTTNSGNDWLDLVSGLSDNWTTLLFIDPNIGFIGGSNKVLKTTNSGNNWSIVLLPQNFRVQSIYFNDANNGCLAGYYLSGPASFGQIYLTTDGGDTWVGRFQGGDYTDLNSIYFSSPDVGYAVGGRVILKTTNRGENWSYEWFASNICNFTSVFFPSSSVGYIVGYDGRILKTGITPVEIKSFNANYYKRSVSISWSTASELNNQGFEIERSTNKNDWIKIGFKEGRGTTTEQQNYSYTDDVNRINIPKLYYRLKQIDFDGSYEYSDIIDVAIAPMKFSLSQNYPNPFNPSTKISWQSPVSGYQTLKVYDVLGREVATLVDEYRDAGSYEVEFQSAVGNRQLASGIYYYRLKVGEFVGTKKMLMLK